LLLDGRNLLGIVALAHLKKSMNLMTGRSENTVKNRSRAFLRRFSLGGRNLRSTVALARLKKRLNLLAGRSENTVNRLRSRVLLLFHRIRVRHSLLGFARARPERSGLLTRRQEIYQEIYYGSRTLRGRGLPPGFLEFPKFCAGRGHITVKKVGRACQSGARFSRSLQLDCCVS
jgi:hypothetical protein